MTSVLPDWLPAWLVALGAGQIAECDVAGLRRCGDSWADIASTTSALAIRQRTAADLAETAVAEGATHTAVAAQHAQLHKSMCDAAAYANSLAVECHRGATSMEFNQLAGKYTLVLLAAQLAADALMFSVGAFKASSDRAAANAALRLGHHRVTTSLAENGATQAITRAGLSPTARTYVFGGVMGAGFGGGVNLWAQHTQIEEGNRDRIDVPGAAESVVTGLVSGLAGVYTALKIAPRVSVVVEKLSHSATNGLARYSAHVTGVMSLGAAGGVGGAVGGVAMSLPLNGFQLPTLHEFAGSLVSGFGGGFLGSAATGLRVAHSAAAHLPAPDTASPALPHTEQRRKLREHLDSIAWLTPECKSAVASTFTRSYSEIQTTTTQHPPRVETTTTTHPNGSREIRVTISDTRDRAVTITVDESQPQRITVAADPATAESLSAHHERAGYRDAREYARQHGNHELTPAFLRDLHEHISGARRDTPDAGLAELANWYNDTLREPDRQPTAIAAELQERVLALSPFDGDRTEPLANLLTSWSLENADPTHHPPLLIGGRQTDPTDPDRPLRVATWNIAGGRRTLSDDPSQSFDYSPVDLPYFADHLRFIDADVVFLQESEIGADGSTARQLADLLGYRHVYETDMCPSHIDTSKRLGIAVLSRIPFDRADAQLLPAPRLDLRIGGQPVEPHDRYAQLVKVAGVALGNVFPMPLHIFKDSNGVRYSYDSGEGATLAQEIGRTVAAMTTEPGVWAGDFNTDSPVSSYGRAFDKVGLSPAFDPDVRTIPPHPRRPVGAPDQLFASTDTFQLAASGVVRADADHYPGWADWDIADPELAQSLRTARHEHAHAEQALGTIISLLQEPGIQVVLLGEEHSNRPAREMLAWHAPELRAAGATHYGIEAVDNPAFGALNNREVGANLTEVSCGPGLYGIGDIGQSYRDVVVAMAEQDITIVPFDLNVSNPRSIDWRTLEQREEHMAQTIAQVLAEQPDAKIVVLVGRSHVEPETWGHVSLSERLRNQGHATATVALEGGYHLTEPTLADGRLNLPRHLDRSAAIAAAAGHVSQLGRDLPAPVRNVADGVLPHLVRLLPGELQLRAHSITAGGLFGLDAALTGQAGGASFLTMGGGVDAIPEQQLLVSTSGRDPVGREAPIRHLVSEMLRGYDNGPVIADAAATLLTQTSNNPGAAFRWRVAIGLDNSNHVFRLRVDGAPGEPLVEAEHRLTPKGSHSAPPHSPASAAGHETPTPRVAGNTVVHLPEQLARSLLRTVGESGQRARDVLDRYGVSVSYGSYPVSRYDPIRNHIDLELWDSGHAGRLVEMTVHARWVMEGLSVRNAPLQFTREEFIRGAHEEDAAARVTRAYADIERRHIDPSLPETPALQAYHEGYQRSLAEARAAGLSADDQVSAADLGGYMEVFRGFGERDFRNWGREWDAAEAQAGRQLAEVGVPHGWTAGRRPVVEIDSDATTEWVDLFHGTDSRWAEVIRTNGVDTNYPRYRCDYGQGFYLTRDHLQATEWASSHPNPTVLHFRVRQQDLDALDGRTFTEDSHDLHEFVRHYRTGGDGTPHDVIEGPILLNPRAVLAGGDPQWSGNQVVFFNQTGTILDAGLQP